MKRKLLAVLSAVILGCAIASAQTIEVNFAAHDPADTALYGRYLNFSGGSDNFNKADFQFYQQQLGRLKMVRIWGTSYIDYATQIADEALMVDSKGIDLNKLINGGISEDQDVAVAKKTLGDLKARYPFITHIEPFNELTDKNLQLPHGMTIEEAYYKGYRVMMRAVSDLNHKNNYAKPLLVGGTACMWVRQYRKGYEKNFLAAYAKDPDPAKHLDFISVHYYTPDAKAALSFRHDLEAVMAEYHIPVVPMIMSEIGWKEKDAKAHDGNPKDALRWATGSLAHTYQIAEQNVVPMHWVYPRKEDRHTMVSPQNEAPALLPKGNAIKLAQMLKKNHAQSTISVDGDGNGVYSVASYDESGIAILLFNYDGNDESKKTVMLKLLNSDHLAAKAGVVTEYTLDRSHANYFADKKAWQLVPVNDGTKTLAALNGKTVQLNGNAAELLLISFAK
jgi:hypothetical protein